MTKTSKRTFRLIASLLLVAFGVGTVTAQEQDSTFWADDAPILGNPDAEVTVMVFSDFQCPACRSASQILKDVIPEFEEDIRLVYLHYPLDSTFNDRMMRQMHPEAGRAAVASMCAAAKGDFWTYYYSLFDNQDSLSESFMLDIAEEMGWERAAFKTCMDAPEMKQRVRDDILRGQSFGVNQTPSIYVSGEFVNLWYNAELLKMVIAQKVREAKTD